MAKQVDPHLGIERFALHATQLHWWFLLQVAVRAHEVLEGHEERGQGNNAIEVLEAGPWPGVELVGAIEAFDQLLEGAVFRALRVEVAQADNGALGEQILLGVFTHSSVVSHHGTIVRGQPVGDQFDGGALRRVRRPVATVDQREGRFGLSAVGKVVAADGTGVLLDDESGVVGEAFDLDVGLISSTGSPGHWSVGIDEAVQIAGGGIDVVDDGLV